ncbi:MULTISPECIES: beta-ketoacyl-ACP synthase III [unclassified Streptomyces]|uniref:beta-ketoacyl-ACP synthase III n=1 Tax=unclassified Streptomyces TaxID=2593676 RepID=UPI001660CA9D|nr:MULTISPECIES: beta-ketoacyl-ACP synthase III [unclassified Streptomyces]MBD0707492.1 3-oxoacyl-ACP synthase [Streptomyces sp. CBMA291]MBD0714487.1 3-oxoacyl-ACP synthase [Streptomyces sp. CBMA370]
MNKDRIPAVVTGLGACLPEKTVTNDDLAQRLDTSHEWIHSRTGIARRRIADSGTSTADLAAAAGSAALESAGRTSCDLVLVATTTPDRACPATAPEVASAMGLTGAAAFDLSAVCSGFVYGLSVAAAMIGAGTFESVLVIGAERYSAIIDPEDRGTAVIFGDGAGAVLLERGREADGRGAVLHTELGSDGSGRDLITVPPGERYLRMEGREVYTRAVPTMVASARRVAEAVGWGADGIDAFVGHQANLRILESVAGRLGLPPERVITNIEDVGNTAGASIPLALAWAAEQGRLSPGDRVVLTAFGGGLTWGSAALIWPDVRPVHR